MGWLTTTFCSYRVLLIRDGLAYNDILFVSCIVNKRWAGLHRHSIHIVFREIKQVVVTVTSAGNDIIIPRL